MKIIKIEFSNINNLKGGPHIIRFNEAPLKAAGIFAITGPTGSGKSTILDVITLALFNRIPRFKKAISKGEIQGLGSVLTHHTNEASALIEYEVKGNRYISKWSVSKTRKGALKDYEMSLQYADGEYLNLKKSEVPAKNEEFIGLKYDQFVKSIILSQGEFAKFLKADKNERGQLLENITGTTIYRKIGAKAFEKFKEVKESVAQKMEMLGNITVLTDEERTEIEAEISQAEKGKKEADAAIKKLATLKQVKTKLAEIKAAIIVEQEKAASLKLQFEAFQPELDKLALHEKLSPVQADLRSYQEALNRVEASGGKLEQYEKELQLSKGQLQTVMQKMADLTRVDVTPDNFKTVMSAFETEVNHMDRDLENIMARGKEQRGNIATRQQDYAFKIGDKAKPKEAIAQLEKQAQEFLVVMAAAGVNETSDIAEYRNQLKKSQEGYILLDKVKAVFLDLDKESKKIASERAAFKNFAAQLEKDEPLFAKSKVLIKELEEKEKLLLKQKEAAIKIAKLEELRAGLVSGEACPLCGSLEHPYSKHNPEDEQSSIEKSIQENKERLARENKALEVLNKKITENETAIKLTRSNIAALENSLEEKTSNRDALLKQYQGEEQLTLETVDGISQKLSGEYERLEKAIHAMEQVKPNKELTEAYRKLAATLSEYTLLKTKRKEKFAGANVSTICNQYQDEFTKIETHQATTTKAIELGKTDLRQANNLVKDFSGKLLPRLGALGFETIDEISRHFLMESAIIVIKNKKEELNRQKTSNETKLNALQKEQAEQTALDVAPELTLDVLNTDFAQKEKSRDELMEKIGGKQTELKRDNQDRKQRKDKEQEIEALNKSLDKWSLLNRMIGDKTGNKFANFTQGLTMQNLLVFTNRRLRNLSDRYLLDKPSGDGDLKVIDLYQGNIERAVSTLSGGETFLISLALALSLSDMASKNVSLDSLFIDEGFGTLDRDTLDVAMNTLERLQSENQKTAGVISHVEALKERIEVQIKLQKDAQGYSIIKVE